MLGWNHPSANFGCDHEYAGLREKELRTAVMMFGNALAILVAV